MEKDKKGPTLADKIINFLYQVETPVDEVVIADALEENKDSVRVTLGKLQKRGTVEKGGVKKRWGFRWDKPTE